MCKQWYKFEWTLLNCQTIKLLEENWVIPLLALAHPFHSPFSCTHCKLSHSSSLYPCFLRFSFFSFFFFSFSFLFCFLRIDPLCVSLNNIGWMRGWMIPHCRRVLCASSSNSVGREVTFSARALSPPTLRFCSRSLPCALLSPLSCTVSLRSWARAFSFPRYL